MCIFECKADYFHLMHIKISSYVVLDKNLLLYISCTRTYSSFPCPWLCVLLSRKELQLKALFSYTAGGYTYYQVYSYFTCDILVWRVFILVQRIQYACTVCTQVYMYTHNCEEGIQCRPLRSTLGVCMIFAPC